MSVDQDGDAAKREAIEDIAEEAGVPSGYERDLDPEYPKWKAVCGCGWAASSFDQSDESGLQTLLSSHLSQCHRDDGTFKRLDQADGDGEVLQQFSGGGR